VLHTAWVVPAFPLAGFILLVLFGSRLGDPKAGWLATAMAVGSFAFSIVLFVGLLGRAPDNRTFIQTLWDWVPVGGFKVSLGLQVDQLSVTMILFVTGVGSLIHAYSIGYMRSDPRFPRFFVYMNLFLLSMLMLQPRDDIFLRRHSHHALRRIVGGTALRVELRDGTRHRADRGPHVGLDDDTIARTRNGGPGVLAKQIALRAPDRRELHGDERSAC